MSDARLQEGPHGAEGSFHLIGDLTPAAFRVTAGGARSNPAIVAQAVLRALAPDLDLGDGEDLRQDRLQADGSGRVHLRFRRYVAGLPVEGLEIHVHFEPDGSVIAVQGVLVPVTAPMAAAAASATERPEKDEIVAGLQEDLRALGTALPRILRLEKVLADQAPYVVWKADVTAGDGLGRWLYRIDAATGEILERQDALEAVVPVLDDSVRPAAEGPAKTGRAASLPPDAEKAQPRTAPRVGRKTALGDTVQDREVAAPAAADEAEPYRLTPQAAEKRKTRP